MGGTGKTPLVKFIASELSKRGFKPGLISRGYGGKSLCQLLRLLKKILTKKLEMKLRF